MLARQRYLDHQTNSFHVVRIKLCPFHRGDPRLRAVQSIALKFTKQKQIDSQRHAAVYVVQQKKFVTDCMSMATSGHAMWYFVMTLTSQALQKHEGRAILLNSAPRFLYYAYASRQQSIVCQFQGEDPRLREIGTNDKAVFLVVANFAKALDHFLKARVRPDAVQLGDNLITPNS
jgi:hypothetical protein